MRSTQRVTMNSQPNFVVLYEMHRLPLRGFLLAATGCPHQAEDLLQNVACVLHVKFSMYEASRPFGPWALGIARLEVLKWRQQRASPAFVAVLAAWRQSSCSPHAPCHPGCKPPARPRPPLRCLRRACP